MSSKKIIFGVSLIAFCCISLGHSIKCFVCNSKASCKKPPLYECNSALGNSTTFYLMQYHYGFHANASLARFECFAENLKSSSGDNYYKGCIYSSLKGCDIPLSPPIAQKTKEQKCHQCFGRDGCNPAARTRLDALTVFATVTTALIFHYLKPATARF